MEDFNKFGNCNGDPECLKKQLRQQQQKKLPESSIMRDLESVINYANLNSNVEQKETVLKKESPTADWAKEIDELQAENKHFQKNIEKYKLFFIHLNQSTAFIESQIKVLFEANILEEPTQTNFFDIKTNFNKIKEQLNIKGFTGLDEPYDKLKESYDNIINFYSWLQENPVSEGILIRKKRIKTLSEADVNGTLYKNFIKNLNLFRKELSKSRDKIHSAK